MDIKLKRACINKELYFVDYICHVYVRSDNVGAVVIADHEYPQRVAHTLLNKVRVI